MNLTPAELQLLSEPPDLSAELQRLLRQIPQGQATSFGDLAEALGDLKAARWVATELLDLDPNEFPVHRVLRRTGKLIGTSKLPLASRRDRLSREGIAIHADTVDLKTSGWAEFSGSKPLVLLRDLQLRLAEQITLPPLVALPERIAGVDVSYGRDRLGVAAYAVVDTETRELLFHETVTAEVRFPYIPGYLSFRELPLYLKLFQTVENAGRLEPFILVDGNGILHPRRAGIASLLGCLLSLHSVGVSKHQLCGTVENRDRAVSVLVAEDGTALGFRLHRDSKRSVLYVSPGTGIDLEGALRLTQSQRDGRRLPVPLFYADRLSREIARRL